MSFFDKIGKLSDKFSTEETVMEVSYEDEETPQPIRAPKKQKPVKKTPPKKEKIQKYQEKKEEIKRNDDFLQEVLGSEEDYEPVSSAFGVSDDFDFIAQKEKEYEEFTQTDPTKNTSLLELLESLGIKKDIDIPVNIFMPEDLKRPDFPIETPRGYDRGEVENFWYQVSDSIKVYTKFLEQRNEDIVKLASEIDRLTRTNQELLIDNEMNQGISFMPTTDNEALEAENQTLQAENNSLRKQLSELTSGGKLKETERDRYNKMQDVVALQQREIEQLEEEILQLKVLNEELREDKDDYLDALVSNKDTQPKTKKTNVMPDLLGNNKNFDTMDDDFSIDDIFNESDW